METPVKLIGYKQLSETRGIDFSRRHLARMAIEKKFPIRVTLGDNSIRWVQSEIDDWLAARLAERDL
jgi:prophage regulatory protein